MKTNIISGAALAAAAISLALGGTLASSTSAKANPPGHHRQHCRTVHHCKAHHHCKTKHHCKQR